jgi:formylmethanofuran dehydrogenase subunit E
VKRDALSGVWIARAINKRPERTAHGYRRFRCADCGKQFNERSADMLNREIIAPSWCCGDCATS